MLVDGVRTAQLTPPPLASAAETLIIAVAVAMGYGAACCVAAKMRWMSRPRVSAVSAAAMAST